MKKEWVCWKLTKGQIDKTIRKLALNPKKLTEKDYENIVRIFMKDFNSLNRGWVIILNHAIETGVKWHNLEIARHLVKTNR